MLGVPAPDIGNLSLRCQLLYSLISARLYLTGRASLSLPDAPVPREVTPRKEVATASNPRLIYADAGLMSTCYHPAHGDWESGFPLDLGGATELYAVPARRERTKIPWLGPRCRISWDTRAGAMALTIERRMRIRLGAWMTVKTAIALGLWLALTQCLAGRRIR